MRNDCSSLLQRRARVVATADVEQRGAQGAWAGLVEPEARPEASAGEADDPGAGQPGAVQRYQELCNGPRRLGSVYTEHVLRHGISRVRGTLAWVDETAAALEPVAADEFAQPLSS